MIRTRTAGFAVLVFALILPFAFPPVAPAAVETAEVELIMDWVPWVLDIPIDVAQARGLYRDAGLTVRQVLPTGPTDVVKFVATGRSQFGLYYAPDLLMAVAEGAPLVSVGSLMPHSPVGLAAAPGLRVEKPGDLVGKVVGVPMIPSVRASYYELLAAGGLDRDAVKLIDPGFNLVSPLLTGTFQAGAFTAFGELVEAQALAGDLDYLDFRDWGTPDFAFLNVITHRDFAERNPRTVGAFLRATLAGLAWAAAHPEEAVDLYVAAHPELKKELLLPQWRAAVPDMTAPAEDRPAGWQEPAAWDRLNAWLVKVRLLKKPVDVGAATSNDYL